MNKPSVLIAFLLVLAVLAVTAAPAQAITWGQPDTTHHNVGAIVVNQPNNILRELCSGTLIHPRVFLSAGHCTVNWQNAGPGTIWVNFDPYALNTATLRNVEKVIPHPEYTGQSADWHDVGLLILSEPVVGIEPVELAPLGYLDELQAAGLFGKGPEKAHFTVVGYGRPLTWQPPTKGERGYRQFAMPEYKALVKAQLITTQNMNAGDSGTCNGDSGGPIFWTRPDGSEVQVGITSWGDQMCVATGFYYRVDIPQTLEFIQQVIDSLED